METPMLTETPTLTTEAVKATLHQGQATSEEALALFDQLEPVDLDFMTGRWRGDGFHTGHAMDGLLEVAGWYGKEFIDPDCVHPLLFSDGSEKVFRVIPNAFMMDLALRMPFPKSESMKPWYILFNSLQQTDESQARLRMMEHRNKVSATMVYDRLPIHDIFRKVDDDTVLGLMDHKGSPQPFFFILRRV
jgi:hypothetical protein